MSAPLRSRELKFLCRISCLDIGLSAPLRSRELKCNANIPTKKQAMSAPLRSRELKYHIELVITWLVYVGSLAEP